ncbi:MAG: response regulator, partial [Hyphomicrobiales bacterium]|nr:response regulator [Hyphomicrobiales bacterium]
PGEGASFAIFLPEAKPVETVADEVAPLRGGRERILLVDDEVDVVATYRRLLIRLGYIVDAYSDPKTALQAFIGAPDRFGAVVSDLIMPDLSGEELATEIRRRRPDCPIVICTGYRSRKLDGLVDENFAVLEKPTEPRVLAQTLRDLLDKSAGRTEATSALHNS